MLSTSEDGWVGENLWNERLAFQSKQTLELADSNTTLVMTVAVALEGLLSNSSEPRWLARMLENA